MVICEIFYKYMRKEVVYLYRSILIFLVTLLKTFLYRNKKEKNRYFQMNNLSHINFENLP